MPDDLIAWISISSIVMTIVIPLFYVQYSIRSQYRDHYRAALDRLLEEMQENHRKMHQFPDQFTELSNHWSDKNDLTEAWLPKEPSFGFHRHILHFLPSKAYYNFMNQGYYTRIGNERLEHLMEFYARCIRFSEHTTELELSINQLDKNSEQFEQDVQALLQRMHSGYVSAMQGFDGHFEGEHGFNPQNREGLEIDHWFDA